MFWNKIASLYDLFENVYNGKVYKNTGHAVAEHIQSSDVVLECACGTGAISIAIAPRCKSLTATDFSEGMLIQAAKKCSRFDSVSFQQANIMSLDYADESFDKVVAGNVIHLLDEPQKAFHELMRVCKRGGKVIIPTYVNIVKNGKSSWAARFLELLGLDFKRQFNYESYQAFIRSMTDEDVSFTIVEGRMPCAIAIINKQHEPAIGTTN